MAGHGVSIGGSRGEGGGREQLCVVSRGQLSSRKKGGEGVQRVLASTGSRRWKRFERSVVRVLCVSGMKQNEAG